MSDDQVMNVGQLKRRRNRFSRETDMRKIKGVTLREKVKIMDTRKELGVNSIQEKVREMILRWYGHVQRMEESNEMRAVVDIVAPRKDQGGDQQGDGGCPEQSILEIKNSGR